MRDRTVGRRSIRPLLAVFAVAGLAACTASPDSAGPTSTSSPPASSAAPTTSVSESPAPDTETTVPAPSPSAPPVPSAGPGAGNAELSIMVNPSEAEPAVNYTLVCQDGVPAAESQHPAADAACTALKGNPALLSPATKNTAQACTQQYGGPQKATVTGVVDGTPIDVTFARTDGCGISAWDAAEAVLGSAGGAT